MKIYKKDWTFWDIKRIWRNAFEVRQIFVKKNILKHEEIKEFLTQRSYILNKKNDYIL